MYRQLSFLSSCYSTEQSICQNLSQSLRKVPYWGSAVPQPNLIGRALAKVAEVEIEGLIQSLEGLPVDSPLGKVEVLAYDDQTIVAMFMGVTMTVPKYPFAIATDIVTLLG